MRTGAKRLRLRRGFRNDWCCASVALLKLAPPSKPACHASSTRGGECQSLGRKSHLAWNARAPTQSRMQHAQKPPQSHTWSSSKMADLKRAHGSLHKGIISSSVKVCRRFLIRKPVCNQQVAKRALSEQNKLFANICFWDSNFPIQSVPNFAKGLPGRRLLGNYHSLNGALVFSLCRRFVLSCSLTLMNQ